MDEDSNWDAVWDEAAGHISGSLWIKLEEMRSVSLYRRLIALFGFYRTYSPMMAGYAQRF